MAKVTLSTAEMNLIKEQDFILTKNNIIQKVYDLFGNVNELYQQILQQQKAIPKQVLAVSAKISRGENYKDLPWVMLDNPRYFNGDDVFAIRTFFWWGNFISINFLVQGRFADVIKSLLKLNKENLNDWFLCCHQNAWQHHFDANNFLPITHFSNQQIDELTFIKLAKKIPLQEWDHIENFLKENFETVVQMFANTSYPSDATSL